MTLAATANTTDLAVTQVTPPPTATPGQPLTVTYGVHNNSAAATAVGSWTDSVYLSLSPTFDASAVLLGRATHNGSVAGSGDYGGSVTGPTPALPPGQYHVFVVADSRGFVPDPDRPDNTASASGTVAIGFPTLTLGTPAAGTVDNGQDAYYQLTLPAGSATRITADFAAPGGSGLYAGYQTTPTTSTFDQSSADPTAQAQSILLTGTQAGTYYVLVHGGAGSTGGQPFTLSAQSLPLEVLSVDTTRAANTGTATLTVHGSMFTSGTTLTLVPQGGGTPIAASKVTAEDSSILFATFNLAGASAGTYDLRATDGSQTATDSGAFTVTSGGPGHLTVHMTEPAAVRPGRTGTLTIDYTNDGGSDLPAPLFVLTADNASLKLPDQSSFSGGSLPFLGINPTGPAGVLPPGAHGTISVDFTPTTIIGHTLIHFSLGVTPDDATPLAWSSQLAALRPSSIPADGWNALSGNLLAAVGSTTGSYVAALDADATYLSQLGEPTGDVSRLFAFEVEKANASYTGDTLATVTDASYPTPGAIPLAFQRQFNATIGGRFQTGPLGRGWTDNWQVAASTDPATGDVTITDDGTARLFLHQPDGSYLPAEADHGTLTLVGNAYQLREKDVTLTAFNPNGTLAFVQDANGNRVSASYNAAGQLVKLTASNGATLTIGYNARGLISQVTDPVNRSSTYTYDASGQHLVAYSDKYGTTHYTYLTGPTAADANALASIAYADNTHIYYSYYALGRLTGKSRDGGAESLSYAYGPAGGYTITDADYAATTYLLDDNGALGATTDALGHVTRYRYDAAEDLTSVVAPDGTTSTFTYDGLGNLTSATDPLGHVTRFTYDPTFSRLLSSTDPRGYTTTYAIDAHGNLTSITNPDNTSQRFLYNPLGELVQWTNARGQATAYSYNVNGQVTGVALPDGTSNTYDNRGNLLTAAGPGGSWSFVYNALDLPTQVTEPNGTLNLTYNIVGQPLQMTDQTGFTVNYGYDALGRLHTMTDGGGHPIDTCTYDPAGDLVGKAKGNGTSTTYQYDPNGDLLQLTNLAPDGKTVNSRFAYTYDPLGRVATMTTAGATTTYGYDASGQLVSVAAPGTSIQYAYDPSGNRTSVTDNGVVTPYTANPVNEYTAVGGTTYGYDADGNLTSATTGGVTTSYTFNSQNQLTALNGPAGTFAYTYDPLGNRIASTVNGTATNNLIDPLSPGTILAQFSGGQLLAHYTRGLGLVSQVAPAGSSAYYDYNLQGSTVGIADATGHYVNQYAYLPFGATSTISAGLSNPFTFVGRFGVTGDGNGLNDMRNRSYDPVTGQFVSADPLGLNGGDANMRRYTANDPTTLVDPLGLKKVAIKNPVAINLPLCHFVPGTYPYGARHTDATVVGSYGPDGNYTPVTPFPLDGRPDSQNPGSNQYFIPGTQDGRSGYDEVPPNAIVPLSPQPGDPPTPAPAAAPATAPPARTTRPPRPLRTPRPRPAAARRPSSPPTTPTTSPAPPGSGRPGSSPTRKTCRT